MGFSQNIFGRNKKAMTAPVNRVLTRDEFVDLLVDVGEGDSAAIARVAREMSGVTPEKILDLFRNEKVSYSDAAILAGSLNLMALAAQAGSSKEVFAVFNCQYFFKDRLDYIIQNLRQKADNHQGEEYSRLLSTASEGLSLVREFPEPTHRHRVASLCITRLGIPAVRAFVSTLPDTDTVQRVDLTGRERPSRLEKFSMK